MVMDGFALIFSNSLCFLRELRVPSAGIKSDKLLILAEKIQMCNVHGLITSNVRLAQWLCQLALPSLIFCILTALSSQGPV